MIVISAYEDRFQADFKRLNLEWLDKYGLTEQHDIDILDNPREAIIDPGGYIFLAMEDDKVVGTAGLYPESPSVLELVKMTVDPAYRGRGISKLLLEHCLEQAHQKGAEQIILFSSSKLQAALTLYEKYGFRKVPVVDSPFLTADVKMELSLRP